ncbi:hypothetical protein [Halobacterium noricense]|uniref:hypothetical protein n=1 Tax=Halobacterium noricense TaxID=223182 RepID=UPI001E5B278E|nr:hypothetical protein [Halobacterium noricense]UHH25108.1 hypothetical protein LT974_14160 [Halobacterium noricense]
MSSQPEEEPETGELDLASLDPSDFRSRSGTLDASALPHKHAPEGLEWEIQSCETDGGEEPPREPSTNEISLVDEDWDSVTLTINVELPQWSYDLVFPDQGELTARIGVVYWCRQTILRDRSNTVEISEPGTKEFEVTIPREDVRQSLKIQPALVCVECTEDAEDFATQPGHRMAEGEVWTVKTDLQQTTQNLLQPETKRFSEDSDFPGEDHLLFVDFDRDPPALYLNGDHERVVAALDSDAYQGWDAAVRDVAYDVIESEFWPQMLLEAASDITDSGGPDEAWKQGVIEKFREPIYGEDTSYEEALDMLREDLNSPSRLARLIQEIDDAVQSRNDSPSHLKTLLDLVDNR